MKNYRMCAIPTKDSLLLSYRLEPGVSEQSYGLFIARMAGMPEKVMAAAEREMTRRREKQGWLESYVAKLDVNAMTPVQSLVCLNELKERVESERK